jgi:exopolyphosphatase / guanosine-5'-triphosphate,3'-diphosphate pyrophosphatase
LAQVAAVDIGSNSVLLLIAELSPDGVRAIEERCEVTRLGKGLDRGELDAAAVERTLEVLADYGARAASATIRAVGTEALRRARDASAFLARAQAALGAPVEILSPEREGSLALRGVTASFPEMHGPLVVLDVGGGSTEVIAAHDGILDRVDSLPLGSVRLHERHVTHDPPTPAELDGIRADVDRALARVPRPFPGSTVVGVAATVTTLAAVSGAVSPYDGARVHGTRLSATDVRRQIDFYARLPAAERCYLPGLDPKRADVILAGALLVERLLSWLGADSLRVSDRGLRWGLLLEPAPP